MKFLKQEVTQTIKWVQNPLYQDTYTIHDRFNAFSEETIQQVHRFQQTHSLYTNTPLISLRHLSRYLNVSEILVKDESKRFGLEAFKVMGGIYAIGKYLANKLDTKIKELSFKDLQSEEIEKKLEKITFISATDGNHGRGIAWAAKELGQKSKIFLPKGSSKRRLKAIQEAGAYAEITDLNYDDTVAMCENLAKENDWVLVQDTAWEGYEEIPLWIMQGYASIAKEMIDEMENDDKDPPTHLILQAGVGSFAASIATYFKAYYKDRSPKIILVEPNLADCYYRSFSSKTPSMQTVTGHMNSIMAGLCCGKPSILAYDLLSKQTEFSFSCIDEIAALGMRVLGNPIGNDLKVVSGESGAVSLGLLFYLRNYENDTICKTLELDENSRIAMINTEGATDLQQYLNVVWKGYLANK